MSTGEAVTSAKSVTGFPIHRIALPIAVAVTTKILALRIRDEITALSKTFLIRCCSSSSARSERKRGEGSSGVKLSFVGIGDASFNILFHHYPVIEGQKATITATI